MTSYIIISKVGEKDPEGWVYARHASASLHPQKELLDFFRRRRWVRMLSCREEGRQPVFYTAKHKAKTKKGKKVKPETNCIIIDTFTVYTVK